MIAGFMIHGGGVSLCFPLVVAGAGFCCAAVRCTDSLSSAPQTADVCREPEGLEALHPGG